MRRINDSWRGDGRISSHSDRNGNRRYENDQSYTSTLNDSSQYLDPRASSYGNGRTSTNGCYFSHDTDNSGLADSRSHLQCSRNWDSQKKQKQRMEDAFDDYCTPQRHQGGRYTYGEELRRASSSVAQSSRHNSSNYLAQQPIARFRVRVHSCRDVFSDFEASQRAPPSTYVAVHTTKERGHSGLVQGEYHPTFNDEFVFTSSHPDNDAVALTLVIAATKGGRPKKVAECVVSMNNLVVGQEREVWVPLVRHPGTVKAYERGYILVSILSYDYGVDSLPSEAVEEAYCKEVHDILMTHAREDLHRLDWFVGRMISEGPTAVANFRQKYTTRAIDPLPLRLTVRDVTGLTGPDGRPTQAETCYVVVSCSGSESYTKTVSYNSSASFEETFRLVLRRPDTDVVTVAAYSVDRKLGEAQVGLTNIRAGVPKAVTLMLVRSAKTGDAKNGGQITLSLRTRDYSSRLLMSAVQEEQLRQRVLAFLWNYRRDDLHRLDAIVAGVDNEDAFMQEWSRTVGPEKVPLNATICIRRCMHAVDGLEGPDGPVEPARCYVRIAVGPYVYRTGVGSMHSNGDLIFTSNVFNIALYSPHTDAIELMLIERASTKEKEVSRVVIGANSVVRNKPTVRTLHLVTDATAAVARVQGDIEVEIVAHDYGLPPKQFSAEERSARHRERLEGLMRTHAPEQMHVVPYMVDVAPFGDEDKLFLEKSKEFGSDALTAPMTVRVMGIREFRPSCDCYVKVYVNEEVLLRTADQKGGAVVNFDISDKNESTIRMTNPGRCTLHFKVGRHNSCVASTVIARTDLSLRNMVRGEENTVWIPLFEGTGTQSVGSGGGGKRSPASVFNGNVMPTAIIGPQGMSATPLGMLGVMVQSQAFTTDSVTIYQLYNGDRNMTAFQAVTRDVSSLLAKYRPHDLHKVQPLIASCTTLRDAHNELRTKMCPKEVGVTVYVHIEKLVMFDAEAQLLEEHCGIVVDASYGEEAQRSYKKKEFMNDVCNERATYTPIRLDLSDAHGLSSATNRCSGIPLELKLVNAIGSVRAQQSSRQSQNRTSISQPSVSPAHRHSESPRRTAKDTGDPNNISSYMINGSERGSCKNNRGPVSSIRGDSAAAHPSYQPSVPPQLGDIGFVQLSLRALLTPPFYRLGDTLSIAVVSPSDRTPDVVGRLTIRVTTAAFDVVPAQLRLASRHALSQINPEYIHNYERRIGAYMRDRCPTDLVDFHYKFYERDVATGRWPVSLKAWVHALEKKYGPETTNDSDSVPR